MCTFLGARQSISVVLDDKCTVYMEVVAAGLDVSGHVARLGKRRDSLLKKLDKLQAMAAAPVCAFGWIF